MIISERMLNYFSIQHHKEDNISEKHKCYLCQITFPPPRKKSNQKSEWKSLRLCFPKL